jgi:predicted ATPase/DNA-binding CsgD family transcriptional regulator
VIVRPVLCRPFIGRREELGYLHERRIEAAASHGGFVIVAGDAGIGKSRLISEFCLSLAYTRWRVAKGACPEFGSRPYGPILEALARVDDRPFTLGEASSKHEQAESIVARFRAIAERRALVVLVEDLHWADAATLEFLAYLGERTQNARILTVASMRADEIDGNPRSAALVAKMSRVSRAGRIDLPPLHGTELRAFIDGALDDIDLPDDARRTVARLSEGNPFFAEELLKSAVEERAAGRASALPRVRTAAGIPTMLRATLLDRLEPLSRDERRVLEQAAVIGRAFSLDLLVATLGATADSVLRALRRARDLQLIDELSAHQFRFRHVLTRDVVYDGFLSAEMRAKHRAIAEVLEAEPPETRALEALAYHWTLAGDAANAARANEIAGDAAARVYAHEDAIASYERAAAQAGLDAFARAAILEKIADRRLILAANEEAMAAFAAAADLFREADASDREAMCRARAAMTAYTMSLTDTTAPLHEALARIVPSERLARSRLHLAIAWINSALRRPATALEHLAQVDARSMESTDIAVRYYNVGTSVAVLAGDVPALRRAHASWLVAARARGMGAVVGVHYNGARFFSALGRHDEARVQIDDAMRLAHELRNRHAEECAQATAALCFVASGDLRAARTALNAVPTTTDNRVNLTFAAAAGTLVAAYTGDDALAAKWFDGCETAICSAPEIEVGAGFAELMVRRGRTRDAELLLHRALPDCEVIRGDALTLVAVGKYGARSDRRRARAYLERAVQTAPDELVESPALALFDAYESRRAGLAAEAARLARDAAEGFRRLGYPLLEAEALEMAGSVESAAALFAQCGASWHVRRLTGETRAAAPETTPSEQLENSKALSAREREVVVLAAGGLSNIDIAKRLGVTHKTVEKHLSAAYRKLDMRSRRDLRAFVDDSPRAPGGPQPK